MYLFENPDQKIISIYIKQAEVIAVVGLSDRESTASYQVAKVMQNAGYRIIPINPRKVGGKILGETVYAALNEITEHIDIVCVFRRSEFLGDVAREFIETDADVFWAQLGLQSQEAEDILRQAGRHKIVMNKCLKVEYFNSLESE